MAWKKNSIKNNSDNSRSRSVQGWIRKVLKSVGLKRHLHLIVLCVPLASFNFSPPPQPVVCMVAALLPRTITLSITPPASSPQALLHQAKLYTHSPLKPRSWGFDCIFTFPSWSRLWNTLVSSFSSIYHSTLAKDVYQLTYTTQSSTYL